MNDKQIDIIEEALLRQPVLQMKDRSLRRLAAILSLHGSEVTASQLKNW
ncbi:putative nodulin homeobox protein [Helianthus debilis subsp. tardiflorus]